MALLYESDVPAPSPHRDDADAATAPDGLAPVAEWSDGPLYGFYSACYVVASPEGYVGYAKVCTGRASSPWSTSTGIAKIGTRGYPTPQQAAHGLTRKVERTLEMRRQRALNRFLQTFRPR